MCCDRKRDHYLVDRRCRDADSDLRATLKQVLPCKADPLDCMSCCAAHAPPRAATCLTKGADVQKWTPPLSRRLDHDQIPTRICGIKRKLSVEAMGSGRTEEGKQGGGRIFWAVLDEEMRRV